jgi:hypothetical protein
MKLSNLIYRFCLKTNLPAAEEAYFISQVFSKNAFPGSCDLMDFFGRTIGLIRTEKKSYYIKELEL